MKKYVAFVVVALFFGFSEKAYAVKSGVTIDSVTVVDNLMGSWVVTAKGTLTLGDNDTFNGAKFEFTDPNGKAVVPIIKQFSAPGQGKTTNYEVYTVTSTQGNWFFTVSEFYTTGGNPAIAGTSKKFTVP